MKRFGLAAGIFLVAGLLALGAFSVLADKGGPGHGADHGEAIGLQDGVGDGVGAQQDGGADGVGEEMIAEAIAEGFEECGLTSEQVLALHNQGHGFGAIFHACTIAVASGMNVEDVLATAASEGFGQMFRDFADEIAALTADDGPKNLGQLVSGAAEASAQGDGQGHAFGRGHDTEPPAGVPAGE